MAYTFKGGIHPDYCKDATAGRPTELLAPPEILVFPMSQHIGAVCQPTVSVGDYVKVSQVIGDSDAPLSSKIHASVSGTVIAIEPRYHPLGVKVNSVIVKNDFKDVIHEGVHPKNKPIEELTSDEIMEMMHQSGIVGMGGAGFPAHVKLKSAIGKVDKLIINGVECEPYLTADHRLMMESGHEIIHGMQILMQCLKLEEAVLAIEDNKPDAIEVMQKLSAEVAGKKIRVAAMNTKYPQGGEKQLIHALTGREVPPGKFPSDVNCAVFNVDTCASVARSYRSGLTVHKRIVTVSGSAINTPKNLSVRIGTPFQALIDACGGFKKEPRKIIMGGPMMGIGQHTLDVPVIKTTSGILCFTEEEGIESSYSVCIRCGKCNRVCPMFLQPNYIGMFARNEQLEECEKLGIASCIECGACTYVCPGRMYLVQEFRIAKLKIAERKRKEKEKAAKEAKGGQKNG